MMILHLYEIECLKLKNKSDKQQEYFFIYQLRHLYLYIEILNPISIISNDTSWYSLQDFNGCQNYNT